MLGGVKTKKCEEKICCRWVRERERGGKNCSVTGLVVERRKKE